MTYEVGQVVYLLNNESLTIIPALVVEEIVRKTLTEQTRQHVVKLPSEEDENKVILESLSQHVFSDVATLRDHMLENTRKSIEKLIQNAVDKKDLCFSDQTKNDNKIDMNVKKKDKIKQGVQKDIKQVIMNSEDNKNNNKDKKEEKWILFFYMYIT